MKRMTITLLSAIGVTGALSAQQKQDLIVAGAQAAPGVGASTAIHVAGAPPDVPHILGLTPDLWVFIATISFIALQAAYVIWKWRRDAKREAREAAERERLNHLIEPAKQKP